MIDAVSASTGWASTGWQPLRAGQRAGRADSGSGDGDRTGSGTGATPAGGADTSDPEVQRQIQQLRATDQKVRTHEQAHVAAGGPYAGSPQYQFTRGPDNRNYAVGGEVPIDASPEREPEATIRKMETVKRAALAPADPSPQDLRVAQQADAAAAQARAELRRQQTEGEEGGGAGAAAGGATDAATSRGLAAYGAASAIGRNGSAGFSISV